MIRTAICLGISLMRLHARHTNIWKSYQDCLTSHTVLFMIILMQVYMCTIFSITGSNMRRLYPPCSTCVSAGGHCLGTPFLVGPYTFNRKSLQCHLTWLSQHAEICNTKPRHCLFSTLGWWRWLVKGIQRRILTISKICYISNN